MVADSRWIQSVSPEAEKQGDDLPLGRFRFPFGACDIYCPRRTGRRPSADRTEST